MGKVISLMCNVRAIVNEKEIAQEHFVWVFVLTLLQLATPIYDSIPCFCLTCAHRLEANNVNTTELLLKITNGAERSKRALDVREFTARDGNDLGLDHAIAAVIKLGNRLDHVEVTTDTARFFKHLVKRKTVRCVDFSVHRLRGRCFSRDSLIDERIENLNVEDNGASWLPMCYEV
jgi:hypothetical protein